MEKNFNLIRIGKTRTTLSTPQWIASFEPDVIVDASANIPKTVDGTEHIDNVDETLKVRIKFRFNFKNPQEFADAVQLLVLGSFVSEIFLPHINKKFIGKFKLTSHSTREFLRRRGNIYGGAIDFAFEARSIFPYPTWAYLISKSENDDRFL